MDIRSIRYFLAVAEEQSFSRAAERLNVAQPAVSRQLQAVEQELGQAVIERSPKGAKLTEFGALYYTRFKDLLKQWDTLLAEARSHKAQKPAPLHIGLPPTSAEDFGATFLQLAASDSPKLPIVFTEGLSRFLNEWLVEKRIDLAVVTHRLAHPNLDYQLLASEPLALLLPNRHPLAQNAQAPLPLAMLDREPLILSTVFYRIFKEHAARHGVTAYCALSIDSVPAARKIMHDSNRASLLPLEIARREAYDPRFVMREVFPPATRPLYLAKRNDELRGIVHSLARGLMAHLTQHSDKSTAVMADPLREPGAQAR